MEAGNENEQRKTSTHRRYNWCLLYVIGDFLFAATGKSQSTESIGLMVKVAYLDMATWRMVVSIICGVLGTALYYIGFHQMWKLLKQRLTQPKQQKWVKLFQIAYLSGTVCWGYVHAMFMNVALIFKFTFVCVREQYQGQGYMRKVMDIAFAEGDRLGVPVILETDAKSKCDKYVHLGMELAGTHDLGAFGKLYDLIMYPELTKVNGTV